MKIRMEVLPQPDITPLDEAQLMIALYPGNSAYPLCTFTVAVNWWEAYCKDPNIEIAPYTRKPLDMSAEAVEARTTVALDLDNRHNMFG